MALSTREIAALFWGGVFLVGVLVHRGGRQHALGIIKAAADRHIVGFLVFMTMWAGGSVLLLRAINVWTPGQMADTAVWFGLAAVVAGGRVVASYNDPDYRKAVPPNSPCGILRGFGSLLPPGRADSAASSRAPGSTFGSSWARPQARFGEEAIGRGLGCGWDRHPDRSWPSGLEWRWCPADS